METTAIYPNRVKDKEKVEQQLGLPEFGGHHVVFKTVKGTVVANSYIRIVYGDHGPYIEFKREQILCSLKSKFNNNLPLPPTAYYEWLIPTDGSNVKVYDQKRDVKHLKNAPKGGVSGNRSEGYADYRVGMIYISPWELVVST